MEVREIVGPSTASPTRVFAVLAAAERWSEWNAGVAGIRLDGPFEEGTPAVMAFPDGSELPFRLTWVEPGTGYEDLTEMPEAGVSVRVRHSLRPDTAGGTEIVYRCEVEGPADAAVAVADDVTSDFAEVVAALAARAEAPVG